MDLDQAFVIYFMSHVCHLEQFGVAVYKASSKGVTGCLSSAISSLLFGSMQKSSVLLQIELREMNFVLFLQCNHYILSIYQIAILTLTSTNLLILHSFE